MQGPSRAAAAASREALTGVLAAGADRSRLAEELFAAVGIIDSSATLRRAVADPSREGVDKAQLAERLFAGKVSAEALVVLKGAFAQRWSSERDLTDTVESYVVEAVIAQAEAGVAAGTVHVHARVDHYDLGALRCEQHCDAAADTTSGARYDRRRCFPPQPPRLSRAALSVSRRGGVE